MARGIWEKLVPTSRPGKTNNTAFSDAKSSRCLHLLLKKIGELTDLYHPVGGMVGIAVDFAVGYGRISGCGIAGKIGSQSFGRKRQVTAACQFFQKDTVLQENVRVSLYRSCGTDEVLTQLLWCIVVGIQGREMNAYHAIADVFPKGMIGLGCGGIFPV